MWKNATVCVDFFLKTHTEIAVNKGFVRDGEFYEMKNK
jgi:hypothetical protein